MIWSHSLSDMFLKLHLVVRMALVSLNEQSTLPLVSQDTSVVDENGDATKGIYSSLNDSGTVCHRRRVDYRLSATYC